ncbi:MFS transporter [Streptomyces sp. Ru73]|uniref:MFS transporter n=1 Tax=Streptomyces sp. Ru73 TaxID=2080748 RepID=UPI0021563D90|nr:MFS transporter [Streptomyces sp. Ru73]
MQDAGTNPSRRERALVPVLLSVGMLVAIISSLGAPLIPTIARVDHVSLDVAQWSLTVTMLVGAVVTPLMGRLGDGPQRRRVILGGLVLTLVGSLLAALPTGFAGLVAGRALQGIGIGLTPLAMATARDALPPERARHAVATLSLTSAAGVGLGYPLTGVLADLLGLHAGFWFAALAAALALVALAVVLPPAPRRPKHPLDVLGALLLAAGLAGLLYATTVGGRWGWGSARLLGLVAVSVLLLAWWVVHELRTAHPLVDVRLVRDRSVLASDLTALLSGVGMYVMLSLVPQYIQTPESAGYGFGASVVVAGLILTPFSVASMVSGRLVRLASRTVAPGRLLPVGCLICLCGTALFTFARSGLWEAFVAMGLIGLGAGVTMSVMPALIVGAVPAHETGSAMSFNQVVKYIGYSGGSAFSAAVLAAHPGVRGLPAESGYRVAGLAGCGVWVLTALVGYLLVRARRSGTAAQRASAAPGTASPAGTRKVLVTRRGTGAPADTEAER